jgi:hypothetical protein
MAADCKSAAPCELRRFESSPVHQDLFVSRLSIALAAYGLLGLLTWLTIADPKFRAVTLVVLGAFALRTLAHHRQQLREAENDSESERRR